MPLTWPTRQWSATRCRSRAGSGSRGMDQATWSWWECCHAPVGSATLTTPRPGHLNGRKRGALCARRAAPARALNQPAHRCTPTTKRPICSWGASASSSPTSPSSSRRCETPIQAGGVGQARDLPRAETVLRPHRERRHALASPARAHGGVARLHAASRGVPVHRRLLVSAAPVRPGDTGGRGLGGHGKHDQRQHPSGAIPARRLHRLPQPAPGRRVP